MYGGDNFRQSQFNLAVQGERQPGSSFKPFVLATALEQGISPTTTFASKPVSIFIGDKYWPVHNYENAYIGSANLATATVVSDNSIYAQLTRLVGPANVAKTARRLGITRHLNPYFAIGLGADAVSPLEMARAFSTFANGGRRVDGAAFGNLPRAIARVDNERGRARRRQPAREPACPLRRRRRTADRASSKTSIRSGTGKPSAASRPGRRRQDRDDGELRRRLVRRLHAAAGDRRLGRLSEQARPDAQPSTTGRPSRAERSLRRSGAPSASWPSPELTPESFPAYPYQYVVGRSASSGVTAGCSSTTATAKSTSLVSYFSGRGPSRTADCKPNEVDIPSVVGMTISRAKRRLAAQPLTPNIVYKPAQAEATARPRARPVPEARACILIRQGHPRPGEAAARRRPERGRADDPAGPHPNPGARLRPRQSTASPTGRQASCWHRRRRRGSRARRGLQIRLVVGHG